MKASDCRVGGPEGERFRPYDSQCIDNKRRSIRDFTNSRARGLFAPRPAVRATSLESFVTMSDSANVDDTPRGAESGHYGRHGDANRERSLENCCSGLLRSCGVFDRDVGFELGFKLCSRDGRHTRRAFCARPVAKGATRCNTWSEYDENEHGVQRELGVNYSLSTSPAEARSSSKMPAKGMLI